MNIFEIFEKIYSFEEETKVYLHEVESDKKEEVLLCKKEKGLFFQIGFSHLKLLNNQEINFVISHNSFDIKVCHFLDKFAFDSSSKYYLNAYIFKSLGFDENQLKYNSYYSKIGNLFFEKLFESNQNFFSIIIDGIGFKISKYLISPNLKYSFLCIECDTKIDFKKFKHYVNNIITSIGFLTGKFFKNEEFYFQSEDKNFSSDVDFFYRSSDKKYLFPRPFTRYPKEWDWKLKDELSEENHNRYSSHIDENIFTSLVMLLFSNQRLYFSIRMLFDFYKTPPISRVPQMFVVLETLCEELNLKRVKVEKENKQDMGFEILSKIKDKIEIEDLKVLTDIVENIDNKLTNNTVHFEQTLKNLGINCKNEEKKILSKRNDFFHGRIIPNRYQIESEEEFISLELKYEYYSLRLYVLISKIILKNIGFRGYLINYPKIFESDNGTKLNESYFEKLK